MRVLQLGAVLFSLVFLACASARKASVAAPAETATVAPVASAPGASASPAAAPQATPEGAATPAAAPSKPAGASVPAAASSSSGSVSDRASLQGLQNVVFALEDKVYGAKKLGTLGLLGELKNCRRRLASRQFGGSGELVWDMSVDRVTEKEAELGASTKTDLSSQSFRFKGYQIILQRRADEIQKAIDACQAEFAKREVDNNQSSKVMVTEVGRAPADKASVNAFLCQFVKKEASLRELMVELFAKGWLSLADFQVDQNLVASNALLDANKDKRDNGLLFSGWKLAFDQGGITIGALLSGDKDGKLKSWAYPVLNDVPGHENCLRKDGVWNP